MKKEYYIYAIGGILGITICYVFFGTNLITGMFLGEAGSPNPQVNQPANSNNINFEVKDRKIEDTDSKLELYNNELAANEQRELEEKNSGSNVSVRVTDLNTLVPNTEEKKKESPRKESSNNPIVINEPVVKKSSAQRTTLKTVEVKTENSTPVKTKKRKDAPTFGEEATTSTQIEADPSKASASGVVHNDQKVTDQSEVIIRLSEELILPDCVLPLNSFVTGFCRISSSRNRMEITITSVKCGKKAIGTDLVVYDDNDGLPGIALRGINDEQAVSKDALNQGVAETARRLNIPIIDKTITSAGDKKINSPTVLLNSGYKVLIKQR